MLKKWAKVYVIKEFNNHVTGLACNYNRQCLYSGHYVAKTCQNKVMIYYWVDVIPNNTYCFSYDGWFTWYMLTAVASVFLRSNSEYYSTYSTWNGTIIIPSELQGKRRRGTLGMSLEMGHPRVSTLKSAIRYIVFMYIVLSQTEVDFHSVSTASATNNIPTYGRTILIRIRLWRSDSIKV